VLLSLARMRLAYFLVIFALLFIPTAMRESLFLPCIDCDDFHATITRHVGVALGLHPADAAVARASANASNASLYSTNRSLGYNCSHPLQNVAPFYAGAGVALPPSAVSQRTFHGYPRYVCPTDDDADALRVLYPECDELLGCETLGGGEDYSFLLTNESGGGPDACSRWMGPYSPVDALDSALSFTNEGTNSTNYTWQPAPLGRYVASPVCVQPFITDWLGLTGPFRFALLLYKALVFPIIFVIFLKILSFCCLMAPWMHKTRRRNERLQRIANKRKAEVRRMTEGGQAFAVKQVSKKLGEQSKEVISRLKALSDIQQETTKQATAANALLAKLGKSGEDRQSRVTITEPSASFASDSKPAKASSKARVQPVEVATSAPDVDAEAKGE